MSVSLVVPAFNEENSIRDLIRHLKYLDRINVFKRIILVDDGSTDKTRKRALEELKAGENNIKFVSLKQNSNKVGAIATGAGLAKSDKIILTDADSRILNPSRIPEITRELDKKGISGIAFQIIPENANNIKSRLWSLFQDLDYSVGRLAHHFTTSEFLRRSSEKKNVRCVPGAGGIYYRDVLLEALEKHSGKHAGDDMEATAIVQLALRDGIDYSNKLKFKTEAPGNYFSLLNQRIRWNKGALQSFNQQKKGFLNEIFKVSRYGLLTLYELGLSFFTPLLMILLFSSVLIWDNSQTFELLKNLYLFDISLTSIAGVYIAGKRDLGNKKSILLLPLLPVYRLLIFYPAKVMAFARFSRTKLKQTMKDEKLSVKIPRADIFEFNHIENNSKNITEIADPIKE